MKKLVSLGESLPPTRSGMLVCLLLAVTFLFNPFLVASPSSTYPSFNHPPSFRANAASSELLKFKPELGIDALLVAASALLAFFASLALQLNLFAQACGARKLFVVQLAPAGNLWFRPPPAA